MQTSLPISTISYNSTGFLKVRLDELVDEEKVSFYVFVYHLREEDENKNHIHLFLQPNKKLDTMKLGKRFLEPDPEGNPLPLKCVDFRKSDYDNWILYDRHYPPYLAWLGQSRKYEYDREMFITNDEVTLDYWWQHALNESDWAIRRNLMKDVESTRNPADLIRNGRIPLAQAGALVAYKRLNSYTFRNGKLGHD